MLIGMNNAFRWVALACCAASIALAGEPAVKCDALAAKSFGDEVKIHSATLVAAKGNLPEHCDVRGVIWPEAGFAIKLPTAWNDRFEMVGNGGTAGTISLGAVDGAVRKGFAAASTDTGHDAAKEPLATFAYVTPENPNGHRKFIDFAYLSVHETAVLAKQVIAAYYGAAPQVFVLGGMFDRRPARACRRRSAIRKISTGWWWARRASTTRATRCGGSGSGSRRWATGAIPAEKLPLLTKAIYEKCDALDGLKDGLIDDPRRVQVRSGAGCAEVRGRARRRIVSRRRRSRHWRRFTAARAIRRASSCFPGELVGSEPVWPETSLLRIRRCCRARRAR